MSLERVGYRRLYDAIGISLADRQELRVEFSCGEELGASIYLGPKPRFGISVFEGDKYNVLGEESILAKIEYKSDAAESSYPRKFFLEVFCWKDIEVNQDLSDAFRTEDNQAQEQLLRVAEEHAESFNAAVDLMTGTIGLSFHRQFAIELINENFLARRTEDDWLHRGNSPSVENLEALTLNPTGIENFVEMLTAVGQEEVRQLEDFVERYVCYVLFGDDRVYQSRWRMKKSVSPEDRQ